MTEKVDNTIPKTQIRKMQASANTKGPNVQKKPKTSVFTQKQNTASKTNNEVKELGLRDTKGAGTKVKSKNGNIYTVIGNTAAGRKRRKIR